MYTIDTVSHAFHVLTSTSLFNNECRTIGVCSGIGNVMVALKNALSRFIPHGVAADFGRRI